MTLLYARTLSIEHYPITNYTQVSPYNLWTVRFLRALTVLFFLITFAWWVLLLVSIFVSPPGMHTHGSGFFDFAYTCLTLGNLLVALVFFANPSSAMRISAAVLATLLLIDVIIIVAVKQVRHEESWVGIASVIWAFVIGTFCVLVDRVVAWGKREEEERLTGRPETRRTLREWVAVLIATIILVLYSIIVLLMTFTLILRSRDASLEMPGKSYTVDGGKYDVHLACYGNATKVPTMILESGELPSEGGFERWAYAAVTNGTIGRYCFWDRPGYAWSDNAPSPHSAGMSADALSEALVQAKETGPWFLVSAGYGSVVSRVFGARHSHDIAGIMLVDGLHEDLLGNIGSPGRGFALWGWGILSPLGVRRILGAVFMGRTRQDRVYGRSANLGGKLLKAKLQENLVADSLTFNEVVQSRAIIDRKIPLVVISSGKEISKNKDWETKQRDLTNLSDTLVAWTTVKAAPHEIWKTLEGRNALDSGLQHLVDAATNKTQS